MPTVTYKRRIQSPAMPAYAAGFMLTQTVTLHLPDAQPFNTPCDTPEHPPLDAAITDPLAIDDPAGDAHYLRANTVDPDNDLDGSQEFGDSDGSEELDGLTVFSPANLLTLRRWLRGYDVL